MVAKTCGLPEQLRALLVPFGAEISLAVVFGSIAKGTSYGRGDIDLLVVGSLKLEALLAALKPAERHLGREIFKATEFKRRRAVGDRFLHGVLAGATVPVIGSVDDVG